VGERRSPTSSSISRAVVDRVLVGRDDCRMSECLRGDPLSERMVDVTGGPPPSPSFSSIRMVDVRSERMVERALVALGDVDCIVEDRSSIVEDRSKPSPSEFSIPR
jgi:hypothetical protein